MRGVLVNLGASAMVDIALVLPWAKEHFQKLAFTPEQVVAASAPWPEFNDPMDESGIYFLQRRGKVCYVGKANALNARLRSHRGRPFDAVTVIAGVPPEACSWLEAAYVRAWNPPWNIASCYLTMDASRALRAALSGMSLDLVCDQPELGSRSRV